MKFNTTRHKLSAFFYDHFTLRLDKQHFSNKVFRLTKATRLPVALFRQSSRASEIVSNVSQMSSRAYEMCSSISEIENVQKTVLFKPVLMGFKAE
jgi:hypothetical protein